jgi:3-oxoacyl-[acyl-carrier protein] reductase
LRYEEIGRSRMVGGLDNRVVLITGMSRGLGERLGRAFWQSGADIFGVARDPAALASVAASLSATPTRNGQAVKVLSCDLTHPNAASAVVSRCVEELGGINILICNAALQGPIGPFWEQDINEWEAALKINLLAPIRLVHAALPSMLKVGGDCSIILLSGGGATAPRPRFSAYATAKTGIVRFAETLAVELRDTNISVNCISPGAMPTKLLAEVVAAGVELAGTKEVVAFERARGDGDATMDRAAQLAVNLATSGHGITGKLIAAQWDRWEDWPQHLEELNASDVYTFRRIIGRDRNKEWGDR